MVGNQTRVKVVKNKVAPPFREVEFDIMYGVGISKTGELLDLGVKGGIIEKSGSWFSYDGQRVGQGRENAKLFLAEHPDMAAKIEAQIRQNAGLIGQTLCMRQRRSSRVSRGRLKIVLSAWRTTPARGVDGDHLARPFAIDSHGVLDSRILPRLQAEPCTA